MAQTVWLAFPGFEVGRSLHRVALGGAASATGERSLLDVRIETGRKHQIRRHLAALCHPVIGARLYGTGAADAVDLQMTAYLRAFRCPVNDESAAYRLAAEWLPTL